MNQINLSYVITTRNKLSYLKEVMKRLIDNLQEDEEIIVIDGASTDGTVEYLADLHQQGKIQQFISEPDQGEAHGYNKGFLMARGELIKDITDDDAFYYPAIQECKKFMLEHEQIDVMSGNTANVVLEQIELNSDHIHNQFKILDDSEYHYKQWLVDGRTTRFIGLPLMIRKKSLALTGLYCTGATQVDLEFTLRITSINANIAWNTSLISVRIDNPQSNYRKIFSRQKSYLDELNKYMFCYDSTYRKKYYLEIIKNLFRPLKRFASQNLTLENSNITLKNKSIDFPSENHELEDNIANTFMICDNFMKDYNSKYPSEIICRS